MLSDVSSESTKLFPKPQIFDFQTHSVCRLHFQIGWKLQKLLQTGRKHCGKKSIMSNLSFSYSVFKRLVLQTVACLGRVLTLSPKKPWFLRYCSTRLLKTLQEKKKLLVMSNFFFSHSVFHPFVEMSAIFIKFEILV